MFGWLMIPPDSPHMFSQKNPGDPICWPRLRPRRLRPNAASTALPALRPHQAGCHGFEAPWTKWSRPAIWGHRNMDFSETLGKKQNPLVKIRMIIFPLFYIAIWGYHVQTQPRLKSSRIPRPANVKAEAETGALRCKVSSMASEHPTGQSQKIVYWNLLKPIEVDHCGHLFPGKIPVWAWHMLQEAVQQGCRLELAPS